MAYLIKDLAERLEESYTWWREHRGEAQAIEQRMALIERAIQDNYDLMSHILEYLNETQGANRIQVPRLVGRW